MFPSLSPRIPYRPIMPVRLIIETTILLFYIILTGLFGHITSVQTAFNYPFDLICYRCLFNWNLRGCCCRQVLVNQPATDYPIRDSKIKVPLQDDRALQLQEECYVTPPTRLPSRCPNMWSKSQGFKARTSGIVM